MKQRFDTSKQHRGWMIAGGIAVLLILAIVIVASVVDEPLRQYSETKANDLLPDFRTTIGALDLHPLTLSVDLHDIVVRQTIHPDPPLAAIPHVTVDARLFPLLLGKATADLRIETPVFSATRQQVDGVLRRAHDQDVQEEAVAWQDQVRDMMAFEGAIHVNNGHLRYEEGKESAPIRLQQINVQVLNVTNRRDADEYPSTIRVTVGLQDESQIDLEGRADFLAKPTPVVDADLKIDRLQIKNLLPVAGRYNLQIRDGALDLNGRVKYSTQDTVVAISELLLEGAKIDYVHAAETKQKEVRRAKKVVEKAKQVHQDPTVRVKIEHGKILNSELGFVNKVTAPDYRVFIIETNADVYNFTNRLEEGTGVVKVTGKFMGSGPTVATGTFRPEKPTPDFDLSVKIIKTKVEAFNNVLRAYGDLDTHKGAFAYFSELSVKDNEIHGYVKPFLKDVEVYDPQQDQDKPLTKKMYEAVIGGVLGVLENKPRKEVATETDLSGPVENPHANTWEVLVKLGQNAFFKAILPTFGKVT
jgi:Domain of Unknown Function (DUF748)